MKILISNDDGYLAPGIAALAQAMSQLGQVTVVAPEQDRSGASNSLTLDRPLVVRQAANGFKYLSGTPTDCVHVAVTGLLDFRPDLVVSGINDGANMGDDTIYSGTVAAAMEGYLLGIPAFAFSMSRKGSAHLQDAAQMALTIVRAYMQQTNPEPVLMNVNFPDLALQHYKGVRTCRLGKRHPAAPAVPATNPRGERVYWLGPAGLAKDAGDGTDFYAVENGWVSMTPIVSDLTSYQQLPSCETFAAQVAKQLLA
jgi:5'-nucleotidase